MTARNLHASSPPVITNFCENIFRSLLKDIHKEVIIWPVAGTAPLIITSSTVMNRIAAIREELQIQQVEQGQQVLLAIPVQFDLICALFAVMALGAIPVLPPANASPLMMLHLLREEKIRYVITRHKTSFPFSLLLRSLGSRQINTKSIKDSSRRWLPPQSVAPDQPALVSYRSGAAGKAKAVRRSHRVLQAQHQVLKAVFPPWPGQRDFPLLPNVLLHNLATGTASLLPDIPWSNITQLNPEKLVRQILDEQVHSLTGNVFCFNKLTHFLEQHPQALPSVSAVRVGGSPVPESLAHALKKFFPRATVFILYGSAEAEPIAIREVTGAPAPPFLGFGVGAVHPSLEYRIRPMGELQLPDRTSYPLGEIEVSGEHVVPSGGDGWLQTGDFGYVDRYNTLFLTGRKGNEKLHGGVQHYQIEHVLLHMAGIRNAAVRSLEDGFAVYIQGSASEGEVKAALRHTFPNVPFQNIFFRESLPIDARHHSKIRYADLE